MVAGVVFIGAGRDFVIKESAALKSQQSEKEQANAENAQQAQGVADESTSAAAASSQMKNSTESGKKMSIADRANLVSKLGDAQEDEEEK